jgi:site-specific DNA recombinase
MIELETRRHDLQQEARDTKVPERYLHPNMAQTYRRKVADLADAISSDTGTALEAVRSLIESVSVKPEGETIGVELVGELDGILAIAAGHNAKGPAVSGGPCSAQLVAGLGFEPRTFRL